MKLQRVRINRTATKPQKHSSSKGAAKQHHSAPSNGAAVLSAMRSVNMSHATAQPLQRAMIARYAAVAGNRAAQVMLQPVENPTNSSLEEDVEAILEFLRERRQRP